MIVTLRKLMRKRVKGQSLVETAIFMPILIILVAGVVEVSNLLVTQNRVSTAARAGTGYGASTFSGEEWDDTGVWSDAMATTALNNVTETLDLDPDRWDIWAIHARVNDAGDAFSEWTAVHGFGNFQVIADLEPSIQSDIMSELQATADSAPIKGLEIAATVAYHDRHSLLGLNAFNFGPLTRVRGLTVMRVDQPAPFTGCPLLPISVRLNQYSAYPSNWPEGMQMNPDLYENDPVLIFPATDDPNGGIQYPNTKDKNYPKEPPVYENNAVPRNLETATFGNNDPGIPLQELAGDEAGVHSGYIYLAREQGPGGGFGWLSWDGSTSAVALQDSLGPPSNFMQMYPESDADMGTTGDPPYGATGNGDHALVPGEWLENGTGNIASADEEIKYYIYNERPVTVIVHEATNNLSGENANYQVYGFIQVRLLAYSFQGNNEEKWILFEFLNWGSACEAPPESES